MRRARSPSTTEAWIRPIASRVGVTRLGDLTGMDRLGIPVYQAVRPLSRALSVAQGKATTRAGARIAALMEAVESWHAEMVEPAPLAPTPEERQLWTAVVRAPYQLQQPDPWKEDQWLAGVDLVSGRPVPVPFRLVSMDFTRPDEELLASTSGLAAGGTRVEAQLSAAAELLERDAHHHWLQLTRSGRRATEVDLSTIADRSNRWLFARIARGGCELRLWDLSEPHGLPIAAAVITERGPDLGMVLPPAMGTGCHPVPQAAVARAILEAAQSRATLIAGARDDITPQMYEDAAGKKREFLLSTLSFGGATRSLAAMPRRAFSSWDEALEQLVGRCAAAGSGLVAMVDLTRPDLGVAVAKLLAPGLADVD